MILLQTLQALLDGKVVSMGEEYKSAHEIEDARGFGIISDSIFHKGMAFFEKHKQDEEDKRMLFRKTLGVLDDLVKIAKLFRFYYEQTECWYH